MSDPRIVGTCDGGNCDRVAVSLAFDWDAGLIPVCRRHISAYKVCDDRWWQAEDEYAGLRFCRGSRWKWLAQRRLLHDQRVAQRGNAVTPPAARDLVWAVAESLGGAA